MSRFGKLDALLTNAPTCSPSYAAGERMMIESHTEG